MNIDTFLESNIIIEEYEFDIPEDMHDLMLTFCMKYAGRPYSVIALFQIAGIMLFNIKFTGDGDKSFVCSELADLFCRQILKLDIPIDQDFISPKTLNTYVKANGKRII
jgi:hypothetical protein